MGGVGQSRQSLGRRRRTGRRLIGRSDARVKAGALTRWSWSAVVGAGVCPAAFVDYRTGTGRLECEFLAGAPGRGGGPGWGGLAAASAGDQAAGATGSIGLHRELL